MAGPSVPTTSTWTLTALASGRGRRGHQRPGLHGHEVLETEGGEIGRCQEGVTVGTGFCVDGEPDPYVLGRAVPDDNHRQVAGLLVWDRGLLDRAGEGPGIAIPGGTLQLHGVGALGEL